MMQSGMFVAAEEFEVAVASGLLTHFKREEDATMKSGKLDEELVRMDAIARQIRPGDGVLFNESFAALLGCLHGRAGSAFDGNRIT